ncbi:MAG: hypothetical protein LBG17_04590 [Bacteroidales bacterium]|jgi:hypothetical protein|nr:hypothetical protein [Bacteroidales bacterium]
MKRKNLLGYDGWKFTAKIWGQPVCGTITVEGKSVFLCQDERNGGNCADKKNHKFSWFVFDGSKYNLRDTSVTKFKLIQKETL